MKKLILTLAVLGLSQAALAKGGGNPAFKNSQAGFVSESLEHSMRVLIQGNPAAQNSVTDASVVSMSLDDSVVTITMDDGSSAVFNCLRFDSTSKGGTIMKKEVVCRAQ